MALLKNRTFRMLFLLLLLLICLGIALYMGAPYLIIKPRKVHYDNDPRAYGMQAEDVAWMTSDSVRLVGWATLPSGRDSSKPVVLFLHGIGNNKESWVSTAQYLYQAGIATIGFDGRAHGESGGTYCTFGFLEKKDVMQIVDWAGGRYPNQEIGVWGNSLGGAIALQSLECDERLKFGIITSTFATLEETVSAYQKRYFLGLQSQAITESALERAGAIAAFEPKGIRPEESAKQIEQPIFYAHGTKDRRIDVSNAERIYKNLASEEKELHLIKGANHFNVWKKGGAAYSQALLSFLNKQGKKQ